MEIPGFTLLLQDFCEYCPDFSPEVEQNEHCRIGYTLRKQEALRKNSGAYTETSDHQWHVMNMILPKPSGESKTN